MRLGSQVTKLASGSRAQACYDADDVHERHRHRYEFNYAYRDRFRESWICFCVTSADFSLVEIVVFYELPLLIDVNFIIYL